MGDSMKCMGDVFKATVCGLAFAIPAMASTVTVNVDEEHQVIRGFGGMVHNQWQGGGGLSEADAKLAFGTGDGQIGLNTLRIPVYANSSDFNKEVQAAKYAKAVAGNDFILYATPWTSNYAGANQHMNSSNYQKYVDHLNEFTAYMKNQGVPLYAISISNEPDWCGEWACWSADEIYNFTKNYADQMRKNGTKVISTESFRYDKNLYNKVLNDANALKNWDILGAHFYASEASTADNFFEYSLADQKNIERWMTEHYTDSQGSGNDWRVVRNTGDQANQNKKDTVRAMDVAYDIHRGLAIGNFSQYTWWYIRRCYGLIMEKDFGNKLSIPQNEIGKISKRGYVMSQYARFIRPGAVRVGATMKPEANVFASAYKSADGDSVIVVLLNRDYKSSKNVTIKVQGADVQTFHMYTTSETKNAKDEGEIEVKDGAVTITMESGTTNKDCIVTLVGLSTPAEPVPRQPYEGKAFEIPGKIEAENFDIMGSGKGNITYKDNDSEDHGAESNGGKSYREDGADIYKSGDNYALGYTQAGEWLEYSVNVKEDGDYYFTARVASGNETSAFSLSLDDKEIVESTTVPKTGEDWETYKDLSLGKIKLTKGEHILRLSITSDYVNIDWLRFSVNENGDDVGSTSIQTKLQLNNVSETYGVFDVNGVMIGKFEAMNKADVARMTKSVARQGGIYFVKSLKTAKSYRISVVK